MGVFPSIDVFLRAFILDCAAAAVEILALRQQVAVFKQSVKCPKLQPRDRIFWEGQEALPPSHAGQHAQSMKQVFVGSSPVPFCLC